MVLLDTCALIWWTLEPGKLSKAAKETIEGIEAKGGFISSISVWEIGVKAKQKKLVLGGSLEEYVAGLRELNGLEIVSVDADLWAASLLLPWDHRDPADRVIVATARTKGVPIITKDEVMKKFFKQIIW